VIALNFDKRLILIGGTEYAGENKKSVFTLLNYLLPAKGVMPMHCSANHARATRSTRRSSSASRAPARRRSRPTPSRVLIGDDEHGWSEPRHLQLRGRLLRQDDQPQPEAEPEIYATTEKFGTVIENMVYDPDTLALDFDDDSLTANMRCAYPLHYISNASPTALGGHPKNVIMLTCDAFGVLPPDRAADARRRRCTTSCRASPRRWPAPSAA
jgi:phosphoenolpyruvate carboxykinase (ATP)